MSQFGNLCWKTLLILATTLVAYSANAGSRDDFLQNVLPAKYPQLVDYLRTNSTLPVFWISLSGEKQSLTVEVTGRNSVMITTMTRTGTAGDTDTPTMVIMIDRDLDSSLDYILLLPQGDEPQHYEKPTDDASVLLWHTSLATIVRYSDCCTE